MKNKLYSHFSWQQRLATCPSWPAPATTKLHADDYALTARRLCPEGAHAQEAAEAFSQYFGASLGVGDTTPSESELAFYTLALQTYAQLNTAQKVTHQTPYTHLMRWFLWRQPNSAQRLLSMVKDLFLFDQDEEITLARTLVMGHPDRARAFLDVPLGAAIIYEILNRTEEAAPLL